MTKIERRFMVITAVIAVSLTCWQFSFARLAAAQISSPAGITQSHHR